MPDATSNDTLQALTTLAARLGREGGSLSDHDLVVLDAAIAEMTASRLATSNVADWLRARAEICLAQEPDPEQPGSEEFTRAWAAGAYNNLHIAANAVEDGRACAPRDQWPPYMRGERVRPRQTIEPMETTDASDTPSA